MTESGIQVRVLHNNNNNNSRRLLKRKYPYSDRFDRHYRLYDNNNESHIKGDSNKNSSSDSFSWAKLFKLSVAINLVHLLNLKCSVHVGYPGKNEFFNAMLLIPRFCKQTVQFTVSFLFAPIFRPQADIQWVKKTWANQCEFMWTRSSEGAAGAGRGKMRLSRLSQVVHLFRVPLSPLMTLLLGPMIHALRQVGISPQQQEQILNSKWVRKSLGWQIKCYRMMPLKSLSTAWGFVNSLNLPVFLRPIVLKCYIKAFGCDISEAEVEDLTYYKNLGEFFRRSLKHGVRPIDFYSPVVSPADGRVLHFGKVENGLIEQVKGVTYSISQFLGTPSWLHDYDPTVDWSDSERLTKSIMHHSAGTSLYHCVIYLAPGDYHRFHSPVEWRVDFRRHFAGELLSVNPKVARFISGLFSLNERAVYAGKWKHGFFSFTAVGATNVGSIRVYDDPELRTNSRRVPKGLHQDKHFPSPLEFEKGQNIGEFNLGSTVVLVFEAPSDFNFHDLHDGKRVQVGQSFA